MKWLVRSRSTGCYVQTAMMGNETSTWVQGQGRALRFPSPDDARHWIKRFFKEYPTSPSDIVIVRVAK
jgi:hypothetical protein